MKIIKQSLVFAVLAIPTGSLYGWRVERFGKVQKNEVSVSAKGLYVSVRGSASPLIYLLKVPEKVSKFKIEGEFHGLPKFSDISMQGQRGFDDYALRLGLVIPGDHRLRGLKALFSPLWIRNLFLQVPDGRGLGLVQFFNFTQNPTQLGSSRIHPLSDLMREDFVALVDKAGSFKLEHTLAKPLETAAIWISIDGDDTKSNFDVSVSKLELMSTE